MDEALRWLPEAERPFRPPAVVRRGYGSGASRLSTTGRILLADDNADMREYVCRLLGEYYEIQTVANGVEALIAAREHPPDLVLTDVMMPELDGFGLLRELRASEATRTIPVILLSARAGEDARIEGLEAGADDYIVKPFTARELLARVSANLSMNRLRVEAADRERALRAQAEAASEHVTTILESISDAFLALDDRWRFTYVNAEAERAAGVTKAELIGKIFWDVLPETKGSNLETQYRGAMRNRVVTQFENYYPPSQRWFEIRVYPAKDRGVSIFFQDITRRKETEDALRRANQALRIANADLEQFAYSASHDLREPLRAVRIYCELLRQNYAGRLDAKANAMIGHCVDGAQRMNALIDGLLAYMRASSDSLATSEAVSPELALTEVLLNLAAAIAESGAVIRHDPMPAIRIAPVHAQQLFQNLIGNALKYRSATPPVIHVGARKEVTTWIFSVQDNGIGIAPEYHERVFEVGKRLHTASEYQGAGIGLAICKKLVERYGGRLWVESEVGKGSTFFFSISEEPSGEEPNGNSR